LLHSFFLNMIFISGQLEAHVSWSCPQTKPELVVTGYKVLIDGKQYGSASHRGPVISERKISNSDSGQFHYALITGAHYHGPLS
jgi:hypothetical protein